MSNSCVKRRWTKRSAGIKPPIPATRCERILVLRTPITPIIKFSVSNFHPMTRPYGSLIDQGEIIGGGGGKIFLPSFSILLFSFFFRTPPSHWSRFTPLYTLSNSKGTTTKFYTSLFSYMYSGTFPPFVSFFLYIKKKSRNSRR